MSFYFMFSQRRRDIFLNKDTRHLRQFAHFLQTAPRLIHENLNSELIMYFQGCIQLLVWHVMAFFYFVRILIAGGGKFWSAVNRSLGLLCTAVLIGWDPATPPRIWAHIREHYWSAKIDEITWPGPFECVHNIINCSKYSCNLFFK